MIEHNPKKRISAKNLMIELSKCTQIWKTQFCENFLRIKKRKHKSFSIFSSSSKTVKKIEYGLYTETNPINPIRNISNEPGGHVKINEIFFQKNNLKKKIVIKEKKDINYLKEKKIKEKKKKLPVSKTLMTNILNEYRSKRNKLSLSICKKEDFNMLNNSQPFFAFKNFS